MTRAQHWQDVYNLWAEWQKYEAADRGYNHAAASVARGKFDNAKSFYEIWYGVEWSESAVPLHSHQGE